MRGGQRRAGEVGGQEGELGVHGADAVAAADEPDEARAEHGVGGGDHGGAEVFEGGGVVAEGLGEEGREVRGGGGGGRGEGGEELVVVPGHGGVVEEGGGGGVARVGY